jgi:citronellol/citronellal dehydrogenase
MASEVFRDGLLDGQVAVVSGGGTGIGRATALELARRGAAITLTARREQLLRSSRWSASGPAAGPSWYPRM